MSQHHNLEGTCVGIATTKPNDLGGKVYDYEEMMSILWHRKEMSKIRYCKHVQKCPIHRSNEKDQILTAYSKVLSKHLNMHEHTIHSLKIEL